MRPPTVVDTSDSADEAIFPPAGIPGFVHFGRTGAIVHTGLSGGLIALEVQKLSSLPDVDDWWEDFDEGDLEAPFGGLRVTAGMYLNTVCPLGPPDSSQRADTLFQVRVSAHGRALNCDGVVVPVVRRAYWRLTH